MRYRLITAMAAAALAGSAMTAAAQETYPSKPIRVIVPEVVGSAADLMSRIVSQHIGELLGQPVTFENLFLGLIGGSGGALLGMLLAWGISLAGIPMPPPPNSNSGYTAFIRVVPWVVVSAFLVGIVATIVAALMPARRVARLPIVDGLRQNQ